MSHRNYSNYSHKNNNEKELDVVDTVDEVKQQEGIAIINIEEPELFTTDNEEIIIEKENNDELVSTTAGLAQVIEESPKEIFVTGYVKEDCALLNVRKEPSIESSKVDVIKKLDEITIDLENSSNDFYKVKTSEGIEGYCMKKFINIK